MTKSDEAITKQAELLRQARSAQAGMKAAFDRIAELERTLEVNRRTFEWIRKRVGPTIKIEWYIASTLKDVPIATICSEHEEAIAKVLA